MTTNLKMKSSFVVIDGKPYIHDPNVTPKNAHLYYPPKSLKIMRNEVLVEKNAYITQLLNCAG